MRKTREINLRFNKDGVDGNEYYIYDFNSLKDPFGMITDINNLGLNNSTKFEKVGNRYILLNSEPEGLNLTFNINFENYEKYRKFIEKCCWSKNYITVNYSIPIQEEMKNFRRDYYLKNIGKAEEKVGILVCPVVLQPISFWYELDQINLKAVQNEWATYEVKNESDLDSEIYFGTNGRFTNLLFQVIGPDFDTKKMNLTYTTPTNHPVSNFCYSSIDNDSYVKVVGLTENLEEFEEDLMTIEYVDFADENILKIPAGKKATIRFKFDEIVGGSLYLSIKIRRYLVSV